MELTPYEINSANKFCNEEVSKLILAKVSHLPLEDVLRIVSMSQMFSFWNEIQELLEKTSEEIVKLKARIKELEEQNAKEKN